MLIGNLVVMTQALTASATEAVKATALALTFACPLLSG